MSTTTLDRRTSPQRPTPRPGTLRIARHTLDVIDSLVLADGLREACGFIVGSMSTNANAPMGTGYRVVPMQNVADDPWTGYAMHPLHLLAFEDGLLTTGEDVVAVWHSHPDRLHAVPSARDIHEARFGTPFQLIVAHRAEAITESQLFSGDFSSPARIQVLGEHPGDLADEVRA